MVSLSKGIKSEELETLDKVVKKITDSEIDRVEEVRDDEKDNRGRPSYSVSDSEIDELNTLTTTNRGIKDSAIEHINELLSSDTGIRDSTVNTIDNIASETTALWNVDAQHIGSVYSSNDQPIGMGGAVKNSDIEHINHLNVEGNALYQSDIETVNEIKAGNFGVVGGNIDEIGTIGAESGVIGANINSIDRIDAEKIGVAGNSKIDKIGEIISGRTAVKNGNSTSSPEIKEIGYIEAGENGLGYSSDVERVLNGIKAGGNALKYNHNTEIFEEIQAENLAFMDSSKNIFVGENLSAKALDGEFLESESHNNLVISDNVDLESFNNNSIVLTPNESDRFLTYTGDFEKLKSKAKQEGTDFVPNLQRFRPNKDSFSSLKELLDEDEKQEEFLQKGIDQFGIGEAEIEQALPITSSFPLNSIYHAQLANKLQNDTADQAYFKLFKVGDFGQTLSEMDFDSRDELYNRLKSEKDEKVLNSEINQHTDTEFEFGDETNLADRLFNIGLDRKYHVFLDNESDWIEELLENSGELPDVADIFEGINFDEISAVGEDYKPNIESSPYLNVLEELKQEYREEIELLSGLSQEITSDGSPIHEGNPLKNLDIVKKLKNKEVGRHAQINNSPLSEEEVNQNLDDNPESYREWFEEGIDSKISDYLSEAIIQIGHEKAEEEYQEVMEEAKNIEEIDEYELGALMVHARADNLSKHSDEGEGWDRVQETVKKLMHNEDEVYRHGENGEWLDRHDFSIQELIDPDLSSHEDQTFGNNSSYRSSLTVEIREENIETDTEDRKERFWERVVDYFEELGIEELDKDQPTSEVDTYLDRVDHSLKQTEEYNELKEAVEAYKSADNLNGGIPDELNFHIASPMETILMGKDLQSCHDVEYGSVGWASISNAVKPNSMVFYAKDNQDDIQARVKAFITEDEELVYHNLSEYKKTEIDTSEYFEGYIQKVGKELGLETKHSDQLEAELEDKVPELEAHDQYLAE